MNKSRLEAFSDGVIAVIITIMVLEMKVPPDASIMSLKPMVPIFFCYVLSFVFVGIYWNNHHHLLQAIKHVNGKILWANLHLLFWLSLIPFCTTWMGENIFQTWPVEIYGVDLLCAAIAWQLLVKTLIAHHGKDSALAKAYGQGLKEVVSITLYLIAIPLAFYNGLFAYALYFIVAMFWLVPDRRIESYFEKHKID